MGQEDAKDFIKTVLNALHTKEPEALKDAQLALARQQLRRRENGKRLPVFEWEVNPRVNDIRNWLNIIDRKGCLSDSALDLLQQLDKE